MITWIRPSGTEMTTNDKPETVEYLESLGWKRKEEKVEPPKRRGRPKKDQ